MSKAWNRRIALAGGAALAAGGASLVLRKPSSAVHHNLPGATVLRRGNQAEPQTLDPSLSTGVQDNNIMGDIMMGLTTEDPLCRPIPGMATHWTSAPDGLTWTFFLRGALWSDGEPVTAEDFVFAWRRTLEPAMASPYAYYLYFLANAAAINAGKLPASALGARAIDAHTLEMKLEHPAPYMLQMLMHTVTFPMPRHVVTAKGRDWVRPGNHVGNGAFNLKAWIPNDHVLIEKNPRFFDAANVALERIFFHPADDYGAALQRMRAGEFDETDRLPTQRIDWIKANMPEAYQPVPLFVTEYLQVNHSRPPFGDARLREAISLALNREAISQRIRRVGDVPAYALIPPSIANYPHDVALDFKSMPLAARLERARSLMRACGFDEKKRFKTSLSIRSTTPGAQRAVAAAIQQMLALIYIDIAILPTDFQVWLAQTNAHDFDIIEGAWVADFDDAATFLELLLTGGGNNTGLYSNPAFDRALASAQADNNLISRGRKLAAAESIAMKDHAIMPLFFWASTGLVWPYVKGWKPNAQDFHRSRWVSIDQAARLKQFA